jgi:hypothetical protein
MSKNFSSNLQTDESGSMLLEASVGLVVILAVLCGILEFSRALFVNDFIGIAARQATRYAMVRGSSWNGVACSQQMSFGCTATGQDVTNFVSSITPNGINNANLRVLVTWPGTTATGAQCSAPSKTNSPSCMVQVKVTYPFSFMLPALPSNLVTFTTVSQAVIAQ